MPQGAEPEPAASPVAGVPTEKSETGRMLDAVFRLERAVYRIGNMRLRPWDLTLSSYAAMRVIADQPDLSLAQLSRRCFVRPQTMTRIVAELDRRGLVARETNAQSKRSIVLTLTPEGHRTLAAMSAEVNKIDDPLTRVLARAEIERLDAVLRHCAILVEQEAEQVAAQLANGSSTDT